MARTNTRARSRYAFSQIVTAFPRWPLQDLALPPHLSSCHFQLGIFLRALGAPGLSFSASPSHLSFPSLSALPHTSPYCGLLRSAWQRTSGRTFAALSPEQGLVCPLAGEGPQRWRLPHQHHSMGLHLQCKPLGEQIAVTKAYFRKIHTQGKGEGFRAG